MTDTTNARGCEQDGNTSLEAVLDSLKNAGNDDTISVNDVLETFSDRSLGVLLIVFGLIAALPLVGAIPGVSVVMGILILTAIIRSLVGGGAIGVPKVIGDREIKEKKLERAVSRSRPYVQMVDGYLKERLTVFTASRAARICIAVCSAVLATSMFPLAVVPFGVQAPATGILAFGLALTARDGVFALIGYFLAAITAYVGFLFL